MLTTDVGSFVEAKQTFMSLTEAHRFGCRVYSSNIILFIQHHLYKHTVMEGEHSTNNEAKGLKKLIQDKSFTTIALS